MRGGRGGGVLGGGAAGMTAAASGSGRVVRGTGVHFWV